MNNINSEAGYLGLVLDQYFVQYLILNEQSLVGELGGDVDQFLTIWANATEDPTSPEGTSCDSFSHHFQDSIPP